MRWQSRSRTANVSTPATVLATCSSGNASTLPSRLRMWRLFRVAEDPGPGVELRRDDDAACLGIGYRAGGCAARSRCHSAVAANPIALQNEPVVEFDRTHNPLRDELLHEQFVAVLDQGALLVPSGPGLGVKVNEKVLSSTARRDERSESSVWGGMLKVGTASAAPESSRSAPNNSCPPCPGFRLRKIGRCYALVTMHPSQGCRSTRSWRDI